MTYNEQSEKNIIKALELLEKGKSIPEILNLFPEQKEELRELFQAMKTVQSAKNSIRPSETLLQEIIFQIPNEAARAHSVPLPRTGQIPDERAEHQENHVPSFGLASWFKFAVPTAAVVIILIAVFYSKLLPKESQEIAQKITEQTATPTVVSPTNTQSANNKKNEKTFSPAPTSLAADNIDALIDEAIAFADNQQFVPDEDADASFINSDDQALDDLGQFYNEEEL